MSLPYTSRTTLRALAMLATLATLATLPACAPDGVSPTAPVGPAPNVSAAATVTVSNVNDAGAGSLRDAIAQAGAAGSPTTITFDDALAGGTISLSSEILIAAAHPVTILGPQGGITISGAGTTNLLVVLAPTELRLERLTLRGGRSTDGDGGAAVLVASTASLTVEHCTFIDNTTLGDEGGGAIASLGTLVVRNSTFRGNGAGFGGAIAVVGGAATIERSSFEENRATGGFGSYIGGGAVHGGATDRVTIVASTFTGNQSTTQGGAISSRGLLLRNSTLSGNHAETVGGGVSSEGETRIEHTTIVGNSADAAGAGIYAADHPLTLASNILATNTLGGGPNLSNCLFIGLPSLALEGTNVSDGTCGVAKPGMIVADPMLGPLADNGGPTRTHLPLFGSPAIDAAPCTIAVDQRGTARPVGLACDAGAAEFTAFETSTLAINGGGTVDSRTGVAVVSGTVACTRAAPLRLRVTVRQEQQARRGATVVTAEGEVDVACGAGTPWAAAVQPATGAFTNANATVTAQVVTTPAGFLASPPAQRVVRFAWLRR